MNTIEVIKQTRAYLDYIEEHVINVNKAWDELKIKCKNMRFIYDDYVFHSINSQIQTHDLSKLSANEFTQYRQHFYPCGGEVKGELSKAWEHHKKHNLHHWDSWTKRDVDNPYEWEIHCVHMIVDWMAMGYKFGDTAQEYYEKNNDKIDIPDYAIGFMYEIFEAIK